MEGLCHAVSKIVVGRPVTGKDDDDILLIQK
jgi:hypothetical protein